MYKPKPLLHPLHGYTALVAMEAALPVSEA